MCTLYSTLDILESSSNWLSGYLNTRLERYIYIYTWVEKVYTYWVNIGLFAHC